MSVKCLLCNKEFDKSEEMKCVVGSSNMKGFFCRPVRIGDYELPLYTWVWKSAIAAVAIAVIMWGMR